MENIIFVSYKIANKLPLQQLAAFFNIENDAVWKDYIRIDIEEIEKILLYDSSKKAVFIYTYGCISFVNFNFNEIQTFLSYLEKLYIDVDNRLMSKFNESFTLNIDNRNRMVIEELEDFEYEFEYVVYDIISTVLAKSLELYKIETELSEVLDESGKFISYLDKGYLRANAKKVTHTIAKTIRFKYRSIESVRIFDIPSEFNKTIKSRHIYDEISNIFELSDRNVVLNNRMSILDSITGEYFEYKNIQSQRRLLMFEALLLAIFPIMHLVR